jgi:hypothetical protein
LAFGRSPTSLELIRSRSFLHDQAATVKPTVDVGAALPYGKMPFREGRAVLVEPGTVATHMGVPDGPKLVADDFTVEAFVLPRSVYDDGRVRPIAAHWSGDPKSPGWSFGLTGKKSSFKPQTLVLQLWGEKPDGSMANEAIFSGLHLDLNKPYFVAVSIHPGETDKDGIAFHIKDLANDDEPLLTAHAAHTITRVKATGSFTIGHSTDRAKERTWEGLIDDVRLSKAVLPVERLLLTREGVTDQTVGYWQFEASGPMRDSSPNGLHLTNDAGPAGKGKIDPAQTALADFCHVLLNANEFLYVD